MAAICRHRGSLAGEADEVEAGVCRCEHERVGEVVRPLLVASMINVTGTSQVQAPHPCIRACTRLCTVSTSVYTHGYTHVHTHVYPAMLCRFIANPELYRPHHTCMSTCRGTCTRMCTDMSMNVSIDKGMHTPRRTTAGAWTTSRCARPAQLVGSTEERVRCYGVLVNPFTCVSHCTED